MIVNTEDLPVLMHVHVFQWTPAFFQAPCLRFLGRTEPRFNNFCVTSFSQLCHAFSNVPVTAQEMQLVRDILARMEAQGTPMPPALWSSGHLGAMSDGSKRLRDQDDFPSSEDELLGEKCTGRTSEDFELIRDAPKSSAQKPVVP